MVLHKGIPSVLTEAALPLSASHLQAAARTTLLLIELHGSNVLGTCFFFFLSLSS